MTMHSIRRISQDELSHFDIYWIDYDANSTHNYNQINARTHVPNGWEKSKRIITLNYGVMNSRWKPFFFSAPCHMVSMTTASGTTTATATTIEECFAKPFHHTRGRVSSLDKDFFVEAIVKCLKWYGYFDFLYVPAHSTASSKPEQQFKVRKKMSTTPNMRKSKWLTFASRAVLIRHVCAIDAQRALIRRSMFSAVIVFAFPTNHTLLRKHIHLNVRTYLRLSSFM